MTSKAFKVANLEYRIGLYHPTAKVQIGCGNPNADIVVVQPRSKMPEKDAVTGALKRFGMLEDAYRATTEMVEFTDTTALLADATGQSKRRDKIKTLADINRYFLKELIEMIDPLLVITCGKDATAIIRDKKIRSFETYSGKKFKVDDLTGCVFCATIDPVEYGFARASQSLKAQGKEEWTRFANLYKNLKEKQEKDRWAC